MGLRSPPFFFSEYKVGSVVRPYLRSDFLSSVTLISRLSSKDQVDLLYCVPIRLLPTEDSCPKRLSFSVFFGYWSKEELAELEGIPFVTCLKGRDNKDVSPLKEGWYLYTLYPLSVKGLVIVHLGLLLWFMFTTVLFDRQGKRLSMCRPVASELTVEGTHFFRW